MVSSFQVYSHAMKDYNKTLNDLQKNKIVKREMEYYKSHIGKVKNVDDLINDSHLYHFVVKAYGLEEVDYAKALIRKVMADPDFSARMRDPRFLELHIAFDFKKFKDKTTGMVAATKETMKRFLQKTLEDTMAGSHEGVRQALYFQRRVQELMDEAKIRKSNWPYTILSDKTLTQVVFNSLGFSNAIMGCRAEVKVKMLEKHMDIKDLTDPARRANFIHRALARYDMKHSTDNYSQSAVALTLVRDSALANAKFMNSLANMPRHGLYR